MSKLRIKKLDKELVPFGPLATGTIFQHCGGFYMKIEAIGSLNAVCLTGPYVTTVFPNDMKTLLVKDAVLEIEP